MKEALRNVRKFLMFHEMSRLDGEMVPYQLSEEHLREIPKLDTNQRIQAFVEFLFRYEMRGLNSSLKRRDNESRLEEIQNEARWVIVWCYPP